MGYEVYVKLYNHKVVQALQKKLTPETDWTKVGNNAEMVGWSACNWITALIRSISPWNAFIPAQTQAQRPGHFGEIAGDPDLPAWFSKYNGRQTIEAGIKEAKQVFYLHRLKVRSEPAIFLQEAMTIFAANFIRWATVWIDQHVEPE